MSISRRNMREDYQMVAEAYQKVGGKLESRMFGGSQKQGFGKSSGRINQKELETLMARGLKEEKAINIIIRGMLK